VAPQPHRLKRVRRCPSQQSLVIFSYQSQSQLCHVHVLLAPHGTSVVANRPVLKRAYRVASLTLPFPSLLQLPPPHSLTALAAHATAIRVARLSNVHLWSSRGVCPCAIYQPLLDVACERIKRSVDVDVALRRDLEERDAEFVCEGLALFCRDGALFFPVALVADEDLVDAFGCVLLDVGEPCANVWWGVSLALCVLLQPESA
jgi:hypothetical protein